MIYELNDTSKVKQIFDGWNETLIYSCIQKVMGKIYVTDIDNPDLDERLIKILQNSSNVLEITTDSKMK